MFETFQLNSGLILNDFDPDNPVISENSIVCATSGGVTVSLEPTYSDFGEDVNGVKNGSMEMKRVSGWSSSMSFTALNVSENVLKVAIGAADIVSANGFVRPRMKLKATDFRDIWWCGERSDGTVVAVCIRNALSTSGLSLETTKSGKGRLSVTLSGHASIKEQYKVPMDFYSAEDVAIEDGGGGEEETPTGVRAYLYNGTKLPELPEWDKSVYPYAIVADAHSTGKYKLYLYAEKPHILYESFVEWITNFPTTDSETGCNMAISNYSDGKWMEFTEKTGDKISFALDLSWSNYDVYDHNGDLYLAGSDPVPLYSYNGVELPEVSAAPDGYPNMLVYQYQSSGIYECIATSEPVEHGYSYLGGGAEANFAKFKSKLSESNEWGGFEETSDGCLGTSFGSLVWANHDIVKTDGSVYLEASDPKPVYM